MNNNLTTRTPEGLKKILAVLDQQDMPYQLRRFDKPAHHAHQAAELVHCTLGAVVKSLVFKGSVDSKFLLVLVSGKNRVDLEWISRWVGDQVNLASPEDVYVLTGYEVGAVPPFGVEGNYSTIIDADLMDFEYVWAAAGYQNIMIKIAPTDLKQLSRGRVVKIN
ncbi:MAG: YbaK/EbsC family protein [Chloroflexota bacterium]|nr:YbaK/EbsC family protein [Chloroflexota bacterium]